MNPVISVLLRGLRLVAFVFILPAMSWAAEETSFDWPLGPIGGKFRIWTGSPYIRVVEVTPSAPGAVAGLQVGDFITGAFGQAFDPITASELDGPVRQLGAAIDHAELNNLVLPLALIRPGSGSFTLNVTLPASDGMNGAYTRNSPRFAALYETACAALHSRIMADSDGDIGYPTGFAGLALLGHANWADTTGPKPYRLSINKIRNWAIGRINGAVLTPVEDLFFDGTANPNFVDNPVGLENWTLGQAVMFISEYVAKTGEQATYQTTLQRGAVLMANRIQNWAQPNRGGTADRSYYTCVGATGHGGVTGDYTHQWYVGINITGLHLFNGLAMAKRAGADMTERPKDGHYFGYALNPGDAIPATISPALPATIILPRGAQDYRSLPHLNNVTNAPLTTITTVNTSENPWFYDCSLDQKFWLQWDCLRRSTSTEGWVAYAAVTGAAYDAGGRTPGTALGMMIYHGSNPLASADQEVVNRQLNYAMNAHDIHLNAHAYNMGGACFTAMLLPWMSDRDQRFFLENWRSFHNLAGQPDGSIRYFQGRDFADPYMDTTDAMHTDVALAGSVARGGLPHIPGFDTNRVMCRVRQPLMAWPTRDAREFTLPAGTQSTSFDLDLLDGNGAVIPQSSVTASWTTLSGPVTTGVFASPASLDSAATFPVAGTYRVQLQASSGGLSTTETINVVVPPAIPPGYIAAEADYRVYTGITGTTVATMTAAAKYPNAPDYSSTLSTLEGTYTGSDFGSTITGVIIPSVSGNYRFYIASDDNSELLFNSTGPNAAGATVVASVTGFTASREWTKYVSQQSVVMALTAGQPYYFQARHKEGSGAEPLAVGWSTPLNSNIEVIGPANIARAIASAETVAAITQHPANASTTLGGSASFTIATTGPLPRIYQWRVNGQNYGPPQDAPQLTLTNVPGRLAGTWDCVFTSGASTLVSAPATLSISGIGTLTSGALFKEVFNGIAGGAITELTNSSKFPSSSDTSGPLTQTQTGTLGDEYGQRWTGWLIPSSSGNYRFYIAADDAIQLYVSPDPYESHKQLIHSSSSYTGTMAWSARGASAWQPLVAGQRYYIEVLHKEGGGGDHCAITWQKEGDAAPVDGSGGIPSGNLQYMTGGYPGDPANTPPLARNDTATVPAGQVVTLSPLANDLDLATSALVITAVTSPSIGKVSIAPDGRSLRFSSDAAATGSTSFDYSIRNQAGVIATATVTITFTPALTSNLLVHLQLDSNTTDISGRSNHGTASGSPSYASGKFGQAITIDSTARNVSLGTPADLNFGTSRNFSVAFWIKTTGWTGDPAFISNKNWSSGNNFGWLIAGQTTGGRWRWNWRANGTSRADFVPSGSNAVINDGNWHLITVTHDRAGNAVFYQDGVQIGTQSIAALTGSIDAGLPTVIGNDATRAYANHPNASFDQVSLWERVLSASDVATLYAASRSYQGTPMNAPTFTGAPYSINGTEDAAVSLQLVASDVDAGDTITFHGVDLPSWLTVSTSGLVSGTPDNSDVGTLNFNVVATDSTGLFTTATVQVNVANIPHTPAFNSSPIAITTGDGALLNQSLASFVTDADEGESHVFTATGIPAWLSLSSSGLLTGSVGYTHAGAHSFTLRATDPGGLFAEVTVEINVLRVNQAPVFSSHAIALNAMEDAAFSTSLVSQLTDLNSPEALTFVYTGVPAWLTANANGTLSGLPGNAQVGAYPMSVRVIDSGNLVDEAVVTVTVVNVNDAPVVQPATRFITVDTPLASVVHTVLSTDEDVGATRSFAITAGNTGNVFAIAPSTGVITVAASPSAAASPYLLTVTNTDNGGASGSAVITVHVAAAPIRWAVDASGSWQTGSNWTGGVRPANGDTAVSFSQVDITATRTVTLDGAVTVSSLQFADSTTANNNWVLNAGTSGSLNFFNTTAAITVTNQTATIGVPLGGAASLVKDGAGMLGLNAANTFGGGTQLYAGGIALGNVAALGTGPVTIAPTASTDTVAASMIVASSLPSGSVIANDFALPTTDTTSTNRAFYMNGSGSSTLELSGKISGGSASTVLFLNNNTSASVLPQYILSNSNNDFRATIRINRGGLRVASNSAAGNAVNAINFTPNPGSTLTYLNPMTFTHPVSCNWLLYFDTGANTVTQTGAISGAGELAKVGAGTLILNAAASNTQPFTVSGGTLLVNSTLASSSIVVNTGTTLGGNGTLSGSVTLNGRLAPGSNGIGALNTAAITAGATPQIAFEIGDWSGAAGSGYDTVNAASLNLSSATSVTVTVAAPSATNYSAVPRSFTLIRTTGGITGFAANKFVLDSSAITQAGTWNISQSGNDLLLNFTPTSTNRAPTFSGMTVSVVQGGTNTVQDSKLLLRVSDLDGDTVTISGIGGATTSHGGTVERLATSTKYTAAVNYTGPDSYDVMITDGTATVPATILVTVTADPGLNPHNPASFNMVGGQPQLGFLGIPGRVYGIQRSTNLTSWTQIGTATAAPNGAVSFQDANPPSTNGFYRIAYPAQ